MKTPIFQTPTHIAPSTDLVFQVSNLINFEAPTSRAPTLSLVQAPTSFLKVSYPLRLQPYLSRHQPCLYEAPTSCFNSSRYIWLYFTTPNNIYNEPCQSLSQHCLLQITSSMTTLSSHKVSPLLFILPKLDL